MDRSAWLKELRRRSEEQETLAASSYDKNWGKISPTHQQWITRFLSLCPPQGRLLDAACGTGKYWPLILESGRTVFGIDHSQGALDIAHQKFPEVLTKKSLLQELDDQAAFDGAICMDALEMVPPEDWPRVLNNLHRALKPQGYFYFTVEITAESDIEQAFAEGQRLGLPVVYGEAQWALEGGYHWGEDSYYHYYPKAEQVKDWVQQSGFHLIEDAVGDDYHHFLVRKR